MSLGQHLRPVVPGLPLADVVSGLGKVAPDTADITVSGVSTDSSDMEPGWIFVAVAGARHHGARFADQAVANGAVAVVTDKEGAELVSNVPVIVVDNPRFAAAELSYRLFSPAIAPLTLVAITGTNGKTTTTHMVRSALESQGSRVALMATGLLDVDGHPHYMLRTTAESPVVQRALALSSGLGYSAAAVEASAHAMTLGRLEQLVFDSVGFTNLQHDHLDYYQTMDNYFSAKAQLFQPEHAKAGVVCIDDEWGRRLAKEAGIPILTVSALTQTPDDPVEVTPDRHWSVTGTATSDQRWGISFTLRSPQGFEYDCFSPIPGLVNVQNAAVAILCAHQAGVSLEQAIAGVANTPSIAGRMELLKGDPTRQPNVLVDYAHTPEALQALLETVKPLVPGRRVLVFGTDGDRDASKREELAEIAAKNAEVLWITDENPRFEDPQSIRDYLLRGVRKVRPDLTDVTEVIQSRRDATRMAIQAAGPGDLVIITGKGSEASQEVQGVFHEYSDVKTATEVLSAPL